MTTQSYDIYVHNLVLIEHPDIETTFEFLRFESRQRYSDVYIMSCVVDLGSLVECLPDLVSTL